MNEIIQQALTQFGHPGELLTTGRDFIETRFGTPGLIAAALLLASVAGLLLAKVTKLSFDIIRYVAIPAVAISFVATYFLPYSIIYILPVTVAFFSIVLMVKA